MRLRFLHGVHLTRRRTPSPTLAAALLLGLVILTGCATPTQPKPVLTPEQRALNVESFEYAWKTIWDRHWDPTLGGLDWQAVHDELKPRVEQAETMRQARAVMNDMIDRLDQSHFAIIPSDTYEALGNSDAREVGDADAGFDLRVIDGEALVISVRPDTPASERGVRPGWRIDRVDGKPVAARLQKIAAEYEQKPGRDLVLARTVQSDLVGAAADTVQMAFADGKGQTVELEIPLARKRGHRFEALNMPPIHVWIEWRRLPDDIGYIAFNVFLDPARVMAEFGKAVQAFADTRGVIIDLRGNPGGLGPMVMGMAGWFIDDSEVYLGTMHMRRTDLKFVVGSRWQTYGGPVAILVDGLSVSTAEILAGGMQDVGRARVFGTRTAGAALPSTIERLPNGDGFQYAYATYVSASGVTLEGNGVSPDVAVETTRADLLAGRDPVLEAAITWIEEDRREP